MINPIALVISTVLAVVFFWCCYETYERRGLDKISAIIGIIPGFIILIVMCAITPGSYQKLYAVMVSIAVMCAIYLIVFWGREFFKKRKQSNKN